MDPIQQLYDLLKVDVKSKKLTHNFNKLAPFLPFPTRNPERPKYQQGFSAVVGELVRLVHEQQLVGQLDEDDVVATIREHVKVNEQDVAHFDNLVKRFIFKDQSIRLFHPYMLRYMPLSQTDESKGEERVAQFIFDTLLAGNKALFSSFFDQRDDEHVLTKLIGQHMPGLKERPMKKRYAGLLHDISEQFASDLAYIVKHRDYFLQHIDLFMAYYYFYMITQLTLRLNLREQAEGQAVLPLYYILDWETASRSRQGYMRGYVQVKEAAKYVLVHMNVLEHLNALFAVEQYDYVQLKRHYVQLSADEQAAQLTLLWQWIEQYADIQGDTTSLGARPTTYEAMVEVLISQVNGGIQNAAKARYALSIEEIGKRYFMKSQGSLGFMLRMTQDLLLLLAALSVRDERIPVKQLFVRLEQRGIFLDRFSREELVELFDKLNLIEKKSDSGDAQYVKPIL